MATYTYYPENIADDGKDKMRFELGDTVVEGGAVTSPLCDEEYESIIGSSESWKRAKLRLLEAIVMKLSYEVSMSVDGLSYSLSDRANRWREMYKELKKANCTAVPKALDGTYYKKGEPHYFFEDMQSNRSLV